MRDNQETTDLQRDKKSLHYKITIIYLLLILLFVSIMLFL